MNKARSRTLSGRAGELFAAQKRPRFGGERMNPYDQAHALARLDGGQGRLAFSRVGILKIQRCGATSILRPIIYRIKSLKGVT